MWFSVLCKMTNGFCCRFSFFEIKVLMRQIVDYCVFFVLNYSWVCAVIHLANVFQLKMTNWWSHESTVQIYPFSGAHGLCVAIGTQRRGTDDLLCLDLFSLCFNLLSRFMETHPVCITHTSLLSFSRSLSFSLSLSLSLTISPSLSLSPNSQFDFVYSLSLEQKDMVSYHMAFGVCVLLTWHDMGVYGCL